MLLRINDKEKCEHTSPDSIMMSSTTTVGIDFPNDSLEQANKSTLVSIINGLTSKLNSVKSELADVREDADRL